MAFNLDTLLKGYEFRVLVEDSFRDKETGQKIPYMTMVVEHPDTCEQTRVSVPEGMRQDLRSYGLRKGEFVDIFVNVRAGSNYNKCTLVSLEHVYSDDGQVRF